MVIGMLGGDANGDGPDRPSTRFGDVRRVASTGSTNADVMAIARDGGQEGVVLVADHQSAGRGRRSRTWEAPAGASLLCSVLLRPPAKVAPLVGMAMGVAAVQTVIEVGARDARLKWPNDVIVVSPGSDGTTAVPDRKLGGILAEADWPPGSGIVDGWREPPASQRVVVVVGLGLNLNWLRSESPEFPDEVAGIAVSLNHLLDHTIDRDELLGALLRHLDRRYSQLVASGPRPLLDAWRDHTATLGRRVRVDLGSEDVVGTALDVTAEGHLIVEEDGGRRRVLAVGDVVHVRPTL